MYRCIDTAIHRDTAIQFCHRLLTALLSAIHQIHPIHKRYIAIQRYSDKKRYIVSDVSPPLREEIEVMIAAYV